MDDDGVVVLERMVVVEKVDSPVLQMENHSEIDMSLYDGDMIHISFDFLNSQYLVHIPSSFLSIRRISCQCSNFLPCCISFFSFFLRKCSVWWWFKIDVGKIVSNLQELVGILYPGNCHASNLDQHRIKSCLFKSTRHSNQQTFHHSSTRNTNQ